MSSQSEQSLRQALSLTRQLLERVVNKEIEGVVELEAERTRLIRQGVAGELPGSLQERVDMLREIQTLDEQITTIGRKSRDEVAEQLRQLHKGRKAGKAYR